MGTSASADPPQINRRIRSLGCRLLSLIGGRVLQPFMVTTRVPVDIIEGRGQFQITVQGGVSHEPLATAVESSSSVLDHLNPYNLAITRQAPYLVLQLSSWCYTPFLI